MPVLHWLKRHLYPLLLVLILSFICLSNFTPSTFLAGWDNLMPELNIWLNIKRSLLSVWQEYQGLGLIGGMAHATDLIRQLILLPFTFVLPLNLIRYLWHFVMLFLGTFGMYFGIKKLFINHKSYFIIPFLSSLFYLLNFGTIQYFWAPLETFSTFWGFFPWLIFSLWDYLNKPSKLSTFRLLIFNLLAVPAFYVQTLFIVYLLCIFLILLSDLFINHKSYFIHLKIILLIILINSFWLLPQIYFVANNLKNPIAGIGNFMSSDESFARNEYRGTIPDFFLLRSYYTDFPDTEGQFMAPWVTHFTNFYILICGYLLGSLVLLGFIYLLARPKKLDFIKLSLLLIFSLTALALLSATPPFAQINSLFRLSGLINQIFRAPFTKFVVPAAFCFSLLTALALTAITNFLSQIKYPKSVLFILHISYLILLFIFSYPVFTGNLISPKLRRQIPPQYFDLFNYLKTQSPSGRIANLPSGSFWGWTNYRWGYRGSGFIWYALPQPVLDRAFDAWNLQNEQYYWELDQALQKKDPYLLSRILKKYSIEYLIFDNNIFFPDEFIYSKLNQATKDVLAQTLGLKLDRQFGQISLYHTSVPTSPYLLENPVSTSTSNFFFEDTIFQQHQDYISGTKINSLDYPFLNLFTSRLQTEFPYLITLESANIIITRRSDNYTATVPLDNSVNLVKNISSPETFLSNRHSFQLLAYNFPLASLGKSYLVKVDYQYFSGLPLTVSINSDNRQQKYLFTRLQKNNGTETAYFVLPAREISDFNQGITVLFNNNSLNNLLTQNQVLDVNFYPIPYYDLAKLSQPSSSAVSTRSYLEFKNHLFYYQVKLPSNFSSSTLVLPQSYSKGWLAFSNNRLLPHVLVNNWANGWSIPSNIQDLKSTIYIFFWPQILEFLGFGLLICTFIWLIKKY